jgi:hypothetical protein
MWEILQEIVCCYRGRRWRGVSLVAHVVGRSWPPAAYVPSSIDDGRIAIQFGDLLHGSASVGCDASWLRKLCMEEQCVCARTTHRATRSEPLKSQPRMWVHLICPGGGGLARRKTLNPKPSMTIGPNTNPLKGECLELQLNMDLHFFSWSTKRYIF